MTWEKSFQKGLAIMLAVLMVVTMLPGMALKAEAAESDKTTLSINDGSIVIGDGTVLQNGNSLTYNASGYIITGSGTTSNTISVTGGSQDITLSGVNIDVSSEDNECAFSIASGASANITLSGSNTLKSSGVRAGLEVPKGASVNISGTGSLTAAGGSSNYNYDDSLNGGGAGIGSGYEECCGVIIISGGTVTSTGGSDECYGGGAGIGSGNGGLGGGAGVSSGSVTISGGEVTATGSNGGAGIGGGASASGGNITISGGTVTANAGVDYGSGGGMGGAGIGGGECASGGSTIITGGMVVANGGVGGAGIGGGEGGSGGSTIITGGTVVANGGSGGAGIGKSGDSGSVSGSTVISGGSVKAVDSNGNISVTGGVTDGSGNTEHCVTVTGLTTAANVNASINGGKTFACETGSSGQLYLWMVNGDNKSTICCNGTYYGANAAVSDADTSTAAGAMEVLDLSWGDITISDGSFSGKDSNGVAASANTYGYVINASSDVEGQTVSVSGGSDSIVLQNVTVNDKYYTISPVSVTGTASVYLTLSGNNTLQSYYAGVEVTGDASVFITGTDDDSLNASSTNYGAGIGGNGDGTDANNCGTITISGGNITALGAKNCAGIGGAYLTAGGSGGNVTISGGTVDAEGGAGAAGIGGSGNGGAAGITVTGGTVTAVGSDGGAGIGGGVHESGTVTITGGTVTSTAVEGTLYKLCGSGIGDGYGGSGSTVKISGGSVNTPSISGTPTSDGSTPVYPTTVTLPSGSDVSSLSITQGSSVTYGINDMQTDSNGTLYLYLPAYADGDTTVGVTADGTAYNGYHGTVKTSGTQASPNVLKMNQSAFSFRNTDTQTFTYGDTISLDTAVTGGTLSGTVSYTYSGNDKLGNTYTSSAICPTNAGDGEYTITATLPGNACYYDATAAKNFVINQKDISTSGLTAAVASAAYTGSALSPSITATFGSNTLAGGTDFEVYDGSGSTKNPTYTAAGDYSVMVKGIGNYTGSVTKTYIIAQIPITLTLTASQSEAKAGGNVALTATVLNAVNLPAGTVTFKYGDTTIQSGVNITESAGKYTAQTTWSDVPAGEYAITAEYVPAANDNYYCSANAEIGSYSITKYDQTGFGFSDNSIDKTFGDSDFTLTASGGQGSGAVTYQSSDDSIASVTDAGVITIKKAGTVTITANKASDSIYNEASDAVTVKIGKAASSIKTAPAVSTEIPVVEKLSSVAFTGGEGSVAGSFAWTNPDTVVSKDGEYEVTFTPADSTDYSACTCKVKVEVTPVITNSGTGVQYDLSDTGLPDGVTSVSVNSSELPDTGSGNSSYSVLSNLIDGSTSAAYTSAVKIYSLSLIDENGQTVTGFTGKITVKIPIPDGMSGDLHVYWYNDADGTVTDMNAKQENGYLVFETTHFSYYAVAELSAKSSSGSGTTPNPDTGNGSFPFMTAALLGISACGLVVVRRSKKYWIKTER